MCTLSRVITNIFFSWLSWRSSIAETESDESADAEVKRRGGGAARRSIRLERFDAILNAVKITQLDQSGVHFLGALLLKLEAHSKNLENTVYLDKSGTLFWHLTQEPTWGVSLLMFIVPFPLFPNTAKGWSTLCGLYYFRTIELCECEELNSSYTKWLHSCRKELFVTTTSITLLLLWRFRCSLKWIGIGSLRKLFRPKHFRVCPMTFLK